MNIIKQLQDADGNNIFPIAYAQGGAKMEVVWQNPNPTTEQSTFSFTINKDYDLYVMEFVNDNSSITNTREYESFILNGYPVNMCYLSYDDTRYNRRFETNVNGTINVLTGYRNGSAYAHASMPLAIYGIKFSWIVPTTVQGLQYIEV